MPGYNVYLSDKTNPELVEAFGKMKAEGILSEFVIESCEVNLPLFLERKIAENEAQKKYFESLKAHYHTTKDKITSEKNSKKTDYLKHVPSDTTGKYLMSWLTSPASIRDWTAAGFKSAQDVIEALEEFRAQKKSERSK
jgi:hypothetical protein